MSNKKWLYWTLQFLGWGSVLSLGLLGEYLQNGSIKLITLEQVVIFLVIAVFTTHLYRNTIIKLNWLDQKLEKLVPRILLGSLSLSIVLLVLNILVDWGFGDTPELDTKILNGIISLFIFTLLWSVFYFAFHFFDKSRKQEVKTLQLETTQKESELINLKNQLKPHFMFNAMNSIRALVDDDPELAKKSITQLSNLLRNTLHLGAKKLISLKEELQIVNDYLALEKIRFEERLMYTQEIDETLLQNSVPPLLIQTLVENAIKHGVSKKTEGGEVSLRIFKDGTNLYINIYNVGEYNPSNGTNSGIGLDNAKQRLNIIYGDQAEFHIGNYEGKVLTEVKIPLTIK